MRLVKSVVVLGLLGALSATPLVNEASAHGVQVAKKHKCDGEGHACKKGHDCKAQHCKPTEPPAEAPAPPPAPPEPPSSPGVVPPPAPAPN